MPEHPRQRGFTLMELLVAMVIAGILLAIAVPNMSSFFARTRLDSAASEFIANLGYARSESIRRGVRITLRNNAANNWGSGWTMFVDTDNDGVLDSGEDTLRVGQALTSPLTMVSDSFDNTIAYLPTGRLSVSVGGSFILCYDKNSDGSPIPRQSKVITVIGTGRPLVGQDSDDDGIPETSSGDITSCNAS